MQNELILSHKMSDPVASEPNLKPCPFCGGKAVIEQKGTSRRSQIIACEDCGCRHESGDVWGMSEPQWNFRDNK